MAELELTSAMARLLSDGPLRAQFKTDPSAVADQLPVRAADRPLFIALDPAELERQARTLISKRYHEVAHLLPRTMMLLGDRAADLFDQHAATYWPTGHRRHAIDAAAFCRFLRRHRHRVHPGEFRRIRCLAGESRLRIGPLHDIFVNGRPRPGLELVRRTRDGGIRAWHICLST